MDFDKSSSSQNVQSTASILSTISIPTSAQRKALYVVCACWLYRWIGIHLIFCALGAITAISLGFLPDRGMGFAFAAILLGILMGPGAMGLGLLRLLRQIFFPFQIFHIVTSLTIWVFKKIKALLAFVLKKTTSRDTPQKQTSEAFSFLRRFYRQRSKTFRALSRFYDFYFTAWLLTAFVNNIAPDPQVGINAPLAIDIMLSITGTCMVSWALYGIFFATKHDFSLMQQNFFIGITTIIFLSIINELLAMSRLDLMITATIPLVFSGSFVRFTHGLIQEKVNTLLQKIRSARFIQLSSEHTIII